MRYLRGRVISALIKSKAKAIYCLALASLFTVSIVYYDPNDPSFNVSTNSEPSNPLGLIGSYIADFSWQFFGIGGTAFAILLLSWGINFFRLKKIGFFKIRVLLGLMLVVISSSLANKLYTAKLFSYINSGGIIGQAMVSQMQYYKIPYLTEILIGTAVILFILSLGFSFYDYLYALKTIIRLVLNSLISIYNILVAKIAPFMEIKHKFAKEEYEEEEAEFAEFDDEDHHEPAFTKISSSKPIAASKPKIAPLVASKPKVGNSKANAKSGFMLPSTDLLHKSNNKSIRLETREELEERANMLRKVLNDFGVKGKIVDIKQGPVVTTYELEPSAGTKASRVIGLADDIARSLEAVSARISTVPGRNLLGIELPNKERQVFNIRELLETQDYHNESLRLPIILGKDLNGKPFIADLARMPHLLVAGTTGSGKSVAINTMIMSILYRYTPDECRLLMVDPKMLELSAYDNIPHLLTPVVTEPGKAVVALKWAVKEMENRYRMMSSLGVRNIIGFNERIEEAVATGMKLTREVQTGFDADTGKPTYGEVEMPMKKLPYIVIIVDEMADLMLVAGKDIETSIQRLAQMARAAGIHLIMATQRPSVDVITGVIKANFPCRVSFKVTSKIDSRTIIGEQGAEQLLGMGDMLFMGTTNGICRLHGPFVADREVEQVARFLKTQGSPEYVTSVTISTDEDEDGMMPSDGESGSDADLYRQAVQIVRRDKKASTSYVQRCLRIGYNRAAILIERMESEGIISPPNHSGKREVLIDGE